MPFDRTLNLLINFSAHSSNILCLLRRDVFFSFLQNTLTLALKGKDGTMGSPGTKVHCTTKFSLIYPRVSLGWNGFETRQLIPLLYVFIHLTVHNVQYLSQHLILLTNKNVTLIYFIAICQQKIKDCGPTGSFQHVLQHRCFYI